MASARLFSIGAFTLSDSDLKELAVDEKEWEALKAKKDPKGPVSRFQTLLNNQRRTDAEVDLAWGILSDSKLNGGPLSIDEVYDGIICYRSRGKMLEALQYFAKHGGKSADDISAKRLYTRVILRAVLLGANTLSEFTAIANQLDTFFRKETLRYFTHSRGWKAGAEEPSKNWKTVQDFVSARKALLERKEKGKAAVAKAHADAAGTSLHAGGDYESDTDSDAGDTPKPNAGGYFKLN